MIFNMKLDWHRYCYLWMFSLQIVTASYTDLQDYTYYFVPAPWLSVKLLRLLQHYPPPEDPGVRGRLNECLDTILNKAQEPPKSKKVQEISLYTFLSRPKNTFFLCRFPLRHDVKSWYLYSIYLHNCIFIIIIFSRFSTQMPKMQCCLKPSA